jgi:hypothetical protein
MKYSKKELDKIIKDIKTEFNNKNNINFNWDLQLIMTQCIQRWLEEYRQIKNTIEHPGNYIRIEDLPF